MIVDMFIFSTELDLLELRLLELSAVVDRFVVIEGTRTFQGHAKPLTFGENAHRFRQYSERIRHVVVEDICKVGKGGAWSREQQQRNCGVAGLSDCSDEDFVMLSDVDEIPRPEAVLRAASTGVVQVFEQRMYRYFLNCRDLSEGAQYSRPGFWTGTVGMPRRMIRKVQTVRDIVGHLWWRRSNRVGLRARFDLWYRWTFGMMAPSPKLVRDGGWHFSYLGGAEAVRAKLASFAHTELQPSSCPDDEVIRRSLLAGEDPLCVGRPMAVEAIDEGFPRDVFVDREKWRRYLLPVGGGAVGTEGGGAEVRR